MSSQVPSVLGMNVIRRCYGEACYAGPPKRCHEASITADRGAGRVKIHGKKACRIPERYSGTTVLFESLYSGLPAGLLGSPALVLVVRGTAYIPTVNVGSSDMLVLGP